MLPRDSEEESTDREESAQVARHSQRECGESHCAMLVSDLSETSAGCRAHMLNGGRNAVPTPEG